MRARHFLIKFFTPLVWRVSERRKLAALQEFSDTELDSGWQSLYAMDRITDPKVKAGLFQHALEEFYHAGMFADLLRSYKAMPLNRSAFAREAILQSRTSPEALLDFLAQVHVGECEINKDFVVYAEANVDGPIRELFQRIKRDEEGHEEVSRELLLGYSNGSLTKLRILLFRKRFALAWKRYLSFTQVLGNIFLGFYLAVIYFALGGFFVTVFRRRLKFSREAHLEILRLQIDSRK